VREYDAEVVAAMGKEIMDGTMRRCTVVVKRVEDGLPVERYILDLGYLGLGMESHQKEAG
jgi:mitotic spindle assembly checkpoint protein MAD2B